MAEVVLAAPDTMLGQLQSGRGAGFLAAIVAPIPDACEALAECIAHDARWDHQIEDRAGYYADLIVAVGFDLQWLTDYAVEHWRSAGASANDDSA